MKNPVFDVNRLQKTFNGKNILSIDAYQIEEGKIYGLLGPNGAGKSTLLKIFALLESPTAGDYKIFGHDYSAIIREKLKWQRKITMVMQTPFLFNQSVFNNVAYGLKVRGITSVKRKQLVEETLEWVGMADMRQQNALTLSGGEAQRIALARAVIFRPEVLLLDEPTASLDPTNVDLIEKLIKKINQQFRTTIILVTHNLFQARRLAHISSVLMEGGIVETGDTAKVFAGAVDEKARAFLAGEMIY